ncbi:MAG: rRNA maturation RNase YbeY [Ignavibacteriota bacterium]|nr:rRNA maturation RNase YbeY [Ignavibacteriales bacterium]MBV6421757.1 Endoribonuclease YbeY [Ignavibacteriaceae bacterium]QKJ97437.1 MAG: rRNA maturation RNase YbeY [Ignavibacteriota bacterium]MCC7094761.1 rRNA maturation RNase YbeY [Ignavibacteriaceae bacterium]NUM61719.1 rRNA maturation RNase YbeY [Ignavibacteriaceae bacterium]
MIKNLRVYSEDIYVNKRAIHSLISDIKQDYDFAIKSLSISFIKSDELLEINRKFLGHNYETDVITFNYSNQKKIIDGEILISFEEAKLNSKKYNVAFGRELNRLVIHGLLHLLDFDDKNIESKKIMKKEENKLVNRYNFTLFAGK